MILINLAIKVLISRLDQLMDSGLDSLRRQISDRRNNINIFCSNAPQCESYFIHSALVGAYRFNSSSAVFPQIATANSSAALAIEEKKKTNVDKIRGCEFSLFSEFFSFVSNSLATDRARKLLSNKKLKAKCVWQCLQKIWFSQVWFFQPELCLVIQ